MVRPTMEKRLVRDRSTGVFRFWIFWQMMSPMGWGRWERGGD